MSKKSKKNRTASDSTFTEIDAPFSPETGLKIETFADAAGGARWRLVSGNNKIIASSGESFTRMPDAVRAAENVINDIIASVENGTLRKVKKAKAVI